MKSRTSRSLTWSPKSGGRIAARLFYVAALLGNALPVTAEAVARKGSQTSGGGADDYRVTPAFFRSRTSPGSTVIACYEVSEKFGTIPSVELATLVENAFHQWANYIVDKRLTQLLPSQQILTDLSLHAGCNGSENLSIYFGKSNATTDSFRSQFADPFGFAQRTRESNDYPNGGSGGPDAGAGFIWIAPTDGLDSDAHFPTWTPETKSSLAGLILHEMGHVFGNGHVDGTVMSEHIGQDLETDTTLGATPAFLGHYAKIDAQIELFSCMDCATTFPGAETADLVDHVGVTAPDPQIAFRRLFGRAPKLPVHQRFDRVGLGQLLKGSGILTIGDADGEKSFTVSTLTQIASRDDSTPLFVVPGQDRAIHSTGVSYYAEITSLGGEKIPVAVNYNLDGVRARIVPLIGNTFMTRPLFVSAP